MNNFEKLQSMSIDQLAEFLDANCHDDAIYWKWHDKHYCKKCEPVMEYDAFYDRMCKRAYCEIHNKCRFSPENESLLDGKETIRMWLESEAEDNG